MIPVSKPQQTQTQISINGKIDWQSESVLDYLKPKRTAYFVNDLSDTEKEEVRATFNKALEKFLASEEVTVNSASRYLGMEHAKCKAHLALNKSLKSLLLHRQSLKTATRLSRQIERLSDDEKKLLMNQLKSSK